VWAALEWYAGQIEKRSKLACSCTIEAAAAAIEPGPEISTMLFRVVQEALTNAVRHADASRVSIHVAIEDGTLVVTVQDDGSGIDTKSQLKRESWGITGMGERARYFGGAVAISGKTGEGTRVQLRLPMEKMKSE
jgi:two-component system sensor histidine kinase UhpB